MIQLHLKVQLPGLNEIRSIHPTSIIAAYSTGNAITCGLASTQDGGEAGSACASGTTAGGVVFSEEDVASALIASVPDGPESLVHRSGDDGVLEDDPRKYFKLTERKYQKKNRRTWRMLFQEIALSISPLQCKIYILTSPGPAKVNLSAGSRRSSRSKDNGVLVKHIYNMPCLVRL